MNRLTHISARTLKIALIFAPMLIYGLYLAMAAADRYVSESVVSVRAAGSDGGAVPGAALLLAGVSAPSSIDNLQLKEFVHSQDLIARLDKALGLRGHYGSAGTDIPYRLSPDASLEDFVKYYRSRVEVLFDERSSLLKVRVQAFHPAFARKVNQLILDESERFINESSHRMARERLQFAEGELQLASTRVQKSRNEVLAFQAKHKLLDPTVQAQASGALNAEFEANRARLEAELSGLQGFLNENAYQVKALRGRIAALNKQIKAEQSRATEASKQGRQLNQLAIEFQGLQLQAEFAKDGYRLAMGAVENARIDATRKIKSVVVIEPPSLAQTAEYPLVVYNLSTLLAICLLLYAIVRLVLATVREHQD